MKKEEIKQLIEKYRKIEIEYGADYEEKTIFYESFVEWLEENIDTFEYVEDEPELFELYKEDNDSSQNWDMLYPNNEEEGYEIPEWE